jgi:hypothetical protein
MLIYKRIVHVNVISDNIAVSCGINLCAFDPLFQESFTALHIFYPCSMIKLFCWIKYLL